MSASEGKSNDLRHAVANMSPNSCQTYKSPGQAIPQGRRLGAVTEATELHQHRVTDGKGQKTGPKCDEEQESPPPPLWTCIVQQSCSQTAIPHLRQDPCPHSRRLGFVNLQKIGHTGFGILAYIIFFDGFPRMPRLKITSVLRAREVKMHGERNRLCQQWPSMIVATQYTGMLPIGHEEKVMCPVAHIYDAIQTDVASAEQYASSEAGKKITKTKNKR
uniref:Uncharacterized protein n=1 Tax=Eutreptiella gymnastica TaxID=73025 RepID=A0A7S4FI30_9EUGL|mmetsp:Transcript_18878/g.30088  ORF Transcript_18878/g.30088 Transcript_18878/m.30088 type:complete len:218 (+) Transcript_18878:728-1381(+)